MTCRRTPRRGRTPGTGGLERRKHVLIRLFVTLEKEGSLQASLQAGFSKGAPPHSGVASSGLVRAPGAKLHSLANKVGGCFLLKQECLQSLLTLNTASKSPLATCGQIWRSFVLKAAASLLAGASLGERRASDAATAKKRPLGVPQKPAKTAKSHHPSYILQLTLERSK